MNIEVIISSNGTPVVKLDGKEIKATVSYPNSWDTVIRFTAAPDPMSKANAKLITSTEYNRLDNPKFEGQTGMNAEGQYKMYCSCNGVMYYTVNEL